MVNGNSEGKILRDKLQTCKYIRT